jgi:hypothetical protein
MSDQASDQDMFCDDGGAWIEPNYYRLREQHSLIGTIEWAIWRRSLLTRFDPNKKERLLS